MARAKSAAVDTRYYLTISFKCKHSRNTYDKYPSGEERKADNWIGTYMFCEGCKAQRIVTNIQKAK